MKQLCARGKTALYVRHKDGCRFNSILCQSKSKTYSPKRREKRRGHKKVGHLKLKPFF